jgi:hypothetical protein
LLLVAAAYDPYKIVSYLRQGKPALKEQIRASENIYLRQIVSIAGQRNASELMPFVVQLAENQLTQEEIMQKRSDISAYFQLLLNTLERSVSSHDPAFIFQRILRKGIKEKSLYFFANHINELHAASESVRFAPVKTLSPEEIYYVITSCSDELYTSSYLGLYKRLMEHFKSGSADSLFQLVQYDNFRVFMRMAANYNVLADFLGRMSHESASLLLKRFISGIESDPATGLEKAMDIADSFIGLDSAAEIAGTIQKELRSNLDRCTSGQQYLGMRLYGILLPVFEMVVKKDSLNDLWAKLGNYELLQRSALQGKDGQIVQMVLFYGDDDGVASFNNFQKLFIDTSKWEITKNESWITVRSLAGQPVILYANIPLDNEEEMDLKAQDALVAYLKQQSIEPSVLIHRGHSYHLGNTLKRLRPSVKLAILGSCGSYNNAISIAVINPDVQIIGSKKTGTKSINDPIIDVINETLQNKDVLSWNEIWEKLRTRFSNDEPTLNLFNEYIPPGKNVSLFVLKLFNFYSKPAVTSSVALSLVK